MPTMIPAAIERQVDFRASPERVWQALTDEREIARWFAGRARVDLRPDALGWLEFEGHGRYPIKVVEVDPPRRFAWRWGDIGDERVEGHASLVEYELEPLPGGGTRLRLRESGFDAEKARAQNVEGWQDVLGSLLEHVAVEPWQAGIRRRYRFTSSPDRIWRAFVEADEFAAWWGGIGELRMTPGADGWFEWPSEGRHAVRIEAVEPPVYLAWLWTIERDTPLAEAREVLRTEWVFWPTDDGGTELRLLETGFMGPENHGQNSIGWDVDVAPILRAHLGEAQEGVAPLGIERQPG